MRGLLLNYIMGKWAIIDLPLSNCVQIQSISHISEEWLESMFSGGITKLHKGVVQERLDWGI